MVKKFKYGFEYKGMNYGWNNKELYRLPSHKGKKYYGLKKLTLIDVGNKKGYNVGRVKKPIDMILEQMTERIDYVYCVPGKDDLPW